MQIQKYQAGTFFALNRELKRQTHDIFPHSDWRSFNQLRRGYQGQTEDCHNLCATPCYNSPVRVNDDRLPMYDFFLRSNNELCPSHIFLVSD